MNNDPACDEKFQGELTVKTFSVNHANLANPNETVAGSKFETQPPAHVPR